MAVAGVIAPLQGRSKEKLERLFRATETLLRTQPFDDLSITQICARAGVSTGTFYNRFKRKDDLLAALYDAYFGANKVDYGQCLSDLAVATSPDDRLRRVIDYFADDYSRHAGVLRSIIVRWRRQPEVAKSAEHDAVVDSYQKLAKALAGEGDAESAMYCLHIIANVCRDFVLFPELLADDTLPGWRDAFRGRLRQACIGLIRT